MARGKWENRRFLALAAAIGVAAVLLPCAAAVADQEYTVTGRIPAQGPTPLNGPVNLKFAIVEGEGRETLWSNDGSSERGQEPQTSFQVFVNGGMFTVKLGDRDLGMPPIPDGALQRDDARLRIWYSVGEYGSFDMLPERKISGTGVAFLADRARRAETLQGKTPADFETAGAVKKHEELFHVNESPGGHERMVNGAEIVRVGSTFSVHYDIFDTGANDVVLSLFGEPSPGPLNLEALTLEQASVSNQKVETTVDILSVRGAGWLAGIRETYEFCNACFKRRMVPRTTIFIDGREYQGWKRLGGVQDDTTPWSRLDNLVPLGLVPYRDSLRVTSYEPGIDDALGTTLVWYYTGGAFDTSPSGIRLSLDGIDLTDLVTAEAGDFAVSFEGWLSGFVAPAPAAGGSAEVPVFDTVARLPNRRHFLARSDEIDLGFAPLQGRVTERWAAAWQGEIWVEPTDGPVRLRLTGPAAARVEVQGAGGFRTVIEHAEPSPPGKGAPSAAGSASSEGVFPAGAKGWYPIRISARGNVASGTLRLARVTAGAVTTPRLRSLPELGGLGMTAWKVGPVTLASSGKEGAGPGEHVLELSCAGPTGGRLSYTLLVRE